MVRLNYAREIAEHDPENIELLAIHTLIKPGDGFEFTGDDFRRLCEPLVYLFMYGNRPLYVGMSSCGVGRPASNRHMQADKAREIATRVLVYPCKSQLAAARLEAMLIYRLKPKLNKRLLGRPIATDVGELNESARVRRYDKRSRKYRGATYRNPEPTPHPAEC